jgi:golgin subfamily A member 4
MMTEINVQITQQKEKRTEKAKEVQEQSEKRSKELIDNFDKDYANFLEDLSAREGTGKKYGKPKRIAQEKLRLEMNKCEQAQISIDRQIEAINETWQHGGSHYPQRSSFLEWRQQLITLQSCMVRYAKHIEAIVPNCQAKPMPRITRKEGVASTLLAAEEEEEDKKKVLEELAKLGPLAEQKDEKAFIKFVEDIEKIIGDEARVIYTGDKAKYITGNDKLPDFLRTYIYNMRKNAESFRQECVRNLRESCNRFTSLAGSLADLFFSSLENYYGGTQAALSSARKDRLDKINKEHSSLRGEHLHKLRPNLCHPDCQRDLKQLDEAEQRRQQEFAALLKEERKQFEEEIFANAS